MLPRGQLCLDFFFKPPTQQLRVKIFPTPLINPLMTPKKLCNSLVNTFQMDTKSVMQENGKQRSNDLLNCGNQTLLIYINSVKIRAWENVHHLWLPLTEKCLPLEPTR